MERHLYGDDSIQLEPPEYTGGKEYLYEKIERNTGFLGLGPLRIFFEIRYYLPE